MSKTENVPQEQKDVFNKQIEDLTNARDAQDYVKLEAEVKKVEDLLTNAAKFAQQAQQQNPDNQNNNKDDVTEATVTDDSTKK